MEIIMKIAYFRKYIWMHKPSDLKVMQDDLLAAQPPIFNAWKESYEKEREKRERASGERRKTKNTKKRERERENDGAGSTRTRVRLLKESGWREEPELQGEHMDEHR